MRERSTPLRRIDHDVGCISTIELRLIIGASTFLVGDAVGRNSAARGRQRTHHGAHDDRSPYRRCRNRGCGTDARVITASSPIASAVVIPVGIHVDVAVDIDILIDVDVAVGIDVGVAVDVGVVIAIDVGIAVAIGVAVGVGVVIAIAGGIAIGSAVRYCGWRQRFARRPRYGLAG